MVEEHIVELDVRPILEAKKEPFKEIMGAVKSLRNGDTLVLHTTFKPTPLLKVMGKKGYSNECFHEGEKHWKIHFRKDEQ